MRNPHYLANSTASEHDIQVAYFMALAMAANFGWTAAKDASSFDNPQIAQNLLAQHDDAEPLLRLAHAIPNGGQRNKIEAGRLRAEGVKPGVFDTFLPVARARYRGLYIEFKKPEYINRKNGGCSNEQMTFAKAVGDQGYAAIVCYTWRDAFEIVERYMKNGTL
jgi:hypothetical protein